MVTVCNDLIPYTQSPIRITLDPGYALGMASAEGEEFEYANEDFEDEEEEAARAAREARGDPAPKRRGRPPGAKNQKGRHK